jgi:hypothetical protein
VTPNQIEQVKSDDEEILEAWERTTDDGHLGGVRAVRLSDDSWPWQVFVSAAEAIGEEPLITAMTAAVTTAIEAVAGVECVEHEERGLWVVAGSVNGRDLVLAVAEVVDSLAPDAR